MRNPKASCQLLKIRSRFDSKPVTLVVGQEGKTTELVAHEIQLCNSRFFETALKKEWLEGQTRKIHLPDDDPETINRYLNFLYTGKIAGASGLDALARLYVYGQKVLDLCLKNAVLKYILEELYDIFERDLFMEGACIVYEGTPSSSLGRKLLVDIFLAVGESDWLKGEGVPEGFGQDALLRFMDFKKRPDIDDDLSISDYVEGP